MSPEAKQRSQEQWKRLSLICLVAYRCGGKVVPMTAKPLFHQQLERSPCRLFKGLPQSHREREDSGEPETGKRIETPGRSNSSQGAWSRRTWLWHLENGKLECLKFSKVTQAQPQSCPRPTMSQANLQANLFTGG